LRCWMVDVDGTSIDPRIDRVGHQYTTFINGWRSVCVCVCVNEINTNPIQIISNNKKGARGLDVSGWESNNRILNHQHQEQEEYHDDDRTSISNQLGDILILGNILRCSSIFLEIG